MPSKRAAKRQARGAEKRIKSSVEATKLAKRLASPTITDADTMSAFAIKTPPRLLGGNVRKTYRLSRVALSDGVVGLNGASVSDGVDFIRRGYDSRIIRDDSGKLRVLVRFGDYVPPLEG